MRTISRRLRGVATTALLWAVVWALTGIAIVAYHIVWHGGMAYARHQPFDVIASVSLEFAFLGAFSGAGFAVALALLERRRTLDQLTLGRVAMCSAFGGVTLPTVSVGANALLGSYGAELLPIATIGVVMGVLGAVCAAGTLALARRPVTPA